MSTIQFRYLNSFKLILQMIFYRADYLRDITFDNHYLTQRFYMLDFKKRWKNENYLLPLTRREMYYYIEPWRLLSLLLCYFQLI